MTTLARRIEDLAERVVLGPPDRTSVIGPRPAPDWGVPLLARLLPEERVRAPEVRRAVLEWAAGHSRSPGHPGLLNGGMTGRAVGLSHAAAIEPRLARLAALVLERVTGHYRRVPPAGTGITSADYDLIAGPAGTVLAMTASRDHRTEDLTFLTEYLSGLCDADELPRLRLGGDGGVATARWNIGRINLGLGHGVPGVLACLVTALPLLGGAERGEAERAIRHVADLLVRHSRQDSHRVVGWPFATAPLDGPAGGARALPTAAEERRQAWCYGTPGIAWHLAEAGLALRDPALREFGVAAMASFAGAWDDERYLGFSRTPGDRLAFCHGAAGLLAVADAFALHTGLRAARDLAEHLDAFLRQRLDEIEELAGTDLTFLNGATGMLAVLLSRAPGRRAWLGAVGLR
ncbi:lanthionine synthetase LanC family protein [Streptosporangium sp. OZ121]|uniref:lanthionine synthetase LanC family protein n=1 Tax=Streptosporangium sp. OZ121 TaxID=3444183 RepID=UPI003F7B19E8